MGSDEPAEKHGRLLRAWQLAILRFAVTLDDGDRQNVLALAREIDHSADGSRREATLHFFRRTSVGLCAAIMDPGGKADTILRRFLAEVDDPRLKRAFAAATEMTQAEMPRTKRRPKPDDDLFRGLPSRKAHA